MKEGIGGFSAEMTQAISDAINQGGDLQRASMRWDDLNCLYKTGQAEVLEVRWYPECAKSRSADYRKSYGNTEGYDFYLQEGDPKHDLPIVSYAMVEEGAVLSGSEFGVHTGRPKVIVMNMHGDTLETPADVFHAIWTRSRVA